MNFLVLKQQSAIGVCAAMATLVFLTLLVAGAQWHSDWLLSQQSSIQTAVAPSESSGDLIARIPDDHLFGKAFSKTGDMPISNLQLRITGIVKVNTEQGGSVSKAYISMEGQPSKIYQVGDSLPYGVKVYEITSDTVILENNGHLEKLPLPREKLQFRPPLNTED